MFVASLHDTVLFIQSSIDGSWKKSTSHALQFIYKICTCVHKRIKKPII